MHYAMNSAERNYWQRFYRSFQENTPTSFAIFVHHFLQDPQNASDKNRVWRLLDIGCGNGRDSYYFAEQQKYIVSGMDVSHTPQPKDGCHFFLSDMTQFDGYDGYDILYARFTFHSITDAQQEMLLAHIQRPDILLCIETRSTKGWDTNCVHGNNSHFRNLTDADRLKNILDKHGFEMLYFEEKDGIARYKNEDPVCIRVICKKRKRFSLDTLISQPGPFRKSI